MIIMYISIWNSIYLLLHGYSMGRIGAVLGKCVLTRARPTGWWGYKSRRFVLTYGYGYEYEYEYYVYIYIYIYTCTWIQHDFSAVMGSMVLLVAQVLIVVMRASDKTVPFPFNFGCIFHYHMVAISSSHLNVSLLLSKSL